MTVAEYEQALESNLQHLHDRVHSGQYWPQPVRRTYIPKGDGGQRPLGIPALEDKIVQGAVAEVLNAVYEADFLGFSYGFRPRRSPHTALATLEQALMTQRVNWVLDLDIRTFFRIFAVHAPQDHRASMRQLNNISTEGVAEQMLTASGFSVIERGYEEASARLPEIRRMQEAYAPQNP